MLETTFDGLDQIRDEVVAPFKLNVNLQYEHENAD